MRMFARGDDAGCRAPLRQLGSRPDERLGLRLGLDPTCRRRPDIRAGGIMQLLLGNIGRPGGGILAMRGHSSIQGSTDVATLYDLLPGYLPQPAADGAHDTLIPTSRTKARPTGSGVTSAST